MADPSQPLVVMRKLRSKLPQRKRCRWQWQLSLSPAPPFPSLSLGSAVSTAGFAKKLRTTESHSKTEASAVETSEDTVISASTSFSWCASSSIGRAAAKGQEERNSEHLKVFGENGAYSESIVRSEVTSIRQHSPTKSSEFSSKLTEKIPEENRKNTVESKDDDVVSVASTDAASSELQVVTTKLSENRSSEFESSLRAASILDREPKSLKCDGDLTCTEQLTFDDDDVPDYSSGYDESFSDLQLPDSCDYDFSSSPYLSSDSGSQFSERSSEDLPPSHTFALLLQFREQFSRSIDGVHSAGKTILDVDGVMNFRLDDEEDAVSYQLFRIRERKQVLLWNHDEQYSEFFISQRSYIVHWMIDYSRVNKLQKETLFLAVSIFDRFLRAGSFKSLRNFQIAGVACLTLANRIEENQPYNSVRQMVFRVGSNTYRRCEVVAMEWLVLEALCFQCCSVTLHNFLWFYLKAARADNQLRKMVKDLAEVALLDHEVRCFWPSTVAASLVIMACPDNDGAQRVIEASNTENPERVL